MLLDICLDQVPNGLSTSSVPLHGKWAMGKSRGAKGGATAALIPDRLSLNGSRLKGADDRAWFEGEYVFPVLERVSLDRLPDSAVTDE
jgi:hypothetical protein